MTVMTMIIEMTRMIEMVMVMMVDDEYNGNDGDGNDVDGCL